MVGITLREGILWPREGVADRAIFCKMDDRWLMCLLFFRWHS